MIDYDKFKKPLKQLELQFANYQHSAERSGMAHMAEDRTRHRRSIRLKEYDYAQAGAYFVTVCTHKRACLFGEIVQDEMQTSDIGALVSRCWDEIPIHFPNAELDSFVLMPNHLHGILVLVDTPQKTCGVLEQFGKPVAGSIPTIVRSFKSAVTRAVGARHAVPLRVWQGNYWEHVVRLETELAQIREYIENNPGQWLLDKLYEKAIAHA